MKNTTNKVYKLFYKSHDSWVGINNVLTLESAQNVKPRVKKALKSKVIIRKVKFV